jgi:pilus assembly protein CpaE
MPIGLLLASADEHFRQMVRDNLLNIPGGKVVAEYPEVSASLYVRVLQDLERHPEAALVVDLAGDTEAGLKAMEKAKQAAPDVYVIASNYHADTETVIAALRSGANDFLLQPLKRLEFREAIARLERAPRKAAGSTASNLGRMYTFLGAKGGVGTTTLAVNFAAVLAQRKQNTVLVDLDWAANDAAMQLGAAPQYTLVEVSDNIQRLDQALFEGFVTRDPLGFFLVGPPDSMEQRGYMSEPVFREFATFLIEKYSAIVVDAGRNATDELAAAALNASSTIFLVTTQDYPSVRNAQRQLAFLMRMGFSQEQIRVLINRYTRKPGATMASLEQVQQTLNQPVFYGIPEAPVVLASINRARPFVADREAAGELDRTFRAFVTKATNGKAE